MQNKTAKGKPSKQASQKKPSKVKEEAVIEPSTEPNVISTEGKSISTEPKEEPNTEVPSLNGYKVPIGEEDLVHVMITRGQRFDPNTGKEIIKPYLQKFGKREWNSLKEQMYKLGYKIELLYEPKF